MPRRSSRQTRSAYATAVDLLTRRAHSEAELGAKLRRRGYTTDEVDAARARLLQSGFLDDRAFAEALVRRRAPSRGARAIAAELAGKGVAREITALVLADVSPGVEEAAASELARRVVDAEPRRLAARLQRRGFSSNAVRRALEEQRVAEP